MDKLSEYLSAEHARNTARSFGGFRYADKIVCADGLELSVQASGGHYCSPRSAVGPWSSVEIGYPSERVEEFMPYVEDEDRPTETVYACVPVETVVAVILAHGGCVAAGIVASEVTE